MRNHLKIILFSVLFIIFLFLFNCTDPVEYEEDGPELESYTTGLLRFIHSASIAPS